MKVLVPVEDIEFGERLVKYIADSKWPPNTTFKVFHVIDPSRLDHFSEVAFMELLDEAAAEEKADAVKLIDTIAARMSEAMPDAEVTQEFVEGQPVQTILDMAKSWNADLIVIGSHGRNAMQRFLLGSVSMAVIGKAPCSVLLVRREEKTAPTDDVSTSRTAQQPGKMHVII